MANQPSTDISRPTVDGRPPTGGGGSAASARKLSVVLVAAPAAGQFLVGLDASVATVALPRIQRDLDASAPQPQWVLMA